MPPINPADCHGHVLPNPRNSLARCGGPTFCEGCRAELASLGITPAEWTAAHRAGLARVLAALLRVCARDYTSEDKQAVLAELLGNAAPSKESR